MLHKSINMIKQARIALIFFLFFLIACKQDEKPVSKQDVLVANRDTTADPSNDFFMYANGGWIKKNPIPGDQGSWTIGHLVVEENLKRLREISEKADSLNAAKGTVEQKIGDFWSTAMDSVKIEEQGLKPLQPYLNKIAAITTRVPVANGALGDFSFYLKEQTSIDQINTIFKEAAAGEYRGIIEYTEEPLVSLDIKSNSHSAIVDGSLTSVIGRQVKVFAFFDNEFGYTSRVIDWLEYWKKFI